MNFKSDNTTGVHPKIIQAIMDANSGVENSYGVDAHSKKLTQKIAEIFETDVSVYLTSTGTAANGLALTALCQPYEYIACHEGAHINMDECGAPTLFSGGAPMFTISGAHGKINIEELRRKIKTCESLRPHTQKIACLSLTQTTECGTVYSIEELNSFCKLKQEGSLAIHMDGARFAYAVASLGCTPADLTWKSGIDVMSFGGTKNGCLNAEAIIFFNQKYAANFDYIHKRGGQLMSKTRFFAAQFLAYLTDDLWIENARHANQMAQKLKNIFLKHKIPIEYPVDANELFVRLPHDLTQALWERNCNFFPWDLETDLYRFVTSFTTSEDELINAEKLIGSLGGKAIAG